MRGERRAVDRAPLQRPVERGFSGAFVFAQLLDQLRDQSGPSGLVRGADPGAVVAVEVFVEEEQIAEASIGLKLRRRTVEGPASVRSAREDADQALRKIARNFPERRHVPRAGREFN